MYVWIWRRLPGGVASKVAGSVVLIVAAVALLFLVVFPWLGPRLPFDHDTVDSPGPSPTASAHASAAAVARP
jgi:hypothetical protein